MSINKNIQKFNSFSYKTQIKKRRRIDEETDNLKFDNELLDEMNSDLINEVNNLRKENQKLKNKNSFLKMSISNIKSLLNLINF